MRQEKIDEQLESRALREGWNMPSGVRAKVLLNTTARASCGIPEVEEKATRTLMKADELVLQREKFERQREAEEHARKLQYIELLIKLGLVVDDSGPARSVDSGAPARVISGSSTCT